MDRINSAVKKFTDHYACSQAILTEYCGHFNLDPELALKIASGFAGGMRFGRTCGAVTGAFMVLGLKFGGLNCEKPEGRKNVYQAVSEFTKQFEEIHGSIRCDTLIGCNVGTPDGMQKAKEQKVFETKCPKFVKTSAKLLETMLQKS